MNDCIIWVSNDCDDETFFGYIKRRALTNKNKEGIILFCIKICGIVIGGLILNLIL